MKIFLLVVIAAMIVYVGIQMGTYYRRRSKILNEILQFCNIFENDLKFNKNCVPQIVKDNLPKFDKEFAKILEAYFLKNMAMDCRYLKKPEQELLEQFFKSLGKSDEEGEIRNLNNYRTELMKIKEDGQAECKKYSGFAVKMGVIIGALVFVIFI